MRKIYVATSYLILFTVSVFVYVRWPAQREHLKFWIPQALLMLTLMVTSFYVLLTSELVDETRRLQQRPILEVTFEEVDLRDFAGPVFRNVYNQGLNLFRGVAKMIGGEQITTPPKSLVMTLKNIGSATARRVRVEIELQSPRGSVREKLEIREEIEKDRKVLVQIAPASLPYVEVTVVSLSYG